MNKELLKLLKELKEENEKLKTIETTKGIAQLKKEIKELKDKHKESASKNTVLNEQNNKLEKEAKDHWFSKNNITPKVAFSLGWLIRFIAYVAIIYPVLKYIITTTINTANPFAFIKKVLNNNSFDSLLTQWIPFLLFFIAANILSLYFIEIHRKHRSRKHKSGIDKLIGIYKNKINTHISLSRTFLTLAVCTGAGGLFFINDSIKQYFSDKDLTSIIAITENIDFGSILYQWIPKFTFLFIIEGIAIYFLNIYRRHDNLATYYGSKESSLRFFRLVFNKEIESKDFSGVNNDKIKRKILLEFAETHKPEYIFKHVIHKRKKKYKNTNARLDKLIVQALKNKK